MLVYVGAGNLIYTNVAHSNAIWKVTSYDEWLVMSG